MRASRRRLSWRAATTLVAALALTVLVPAAVAGQTATVEYYHLDTLGSVRVVTNAAGAVVTRHDFLPFGEEWPAATTTEKKLFTGQERDPETGLDYFGARYYHAPIGRFTTVDPAHAGATPDDPQTWNAYTYARNNPLRYVDPHGLAPTEYYDPQGNWIGTDNVDNGVFSLVTNRKAAKAVRDQQKAKGVVDPATIAPGDHVDLSPLDRALVQWVYENTGSNFEAGAVVGNYGPAAGALEGMLGSATGFGDPAPPGADARINLAAIASRARIVPRLAVHGHPDARYDSGQLQYNQEPSVPDRRGFLQGTNLVVGRGSGDVYFYGPRTYATIPIDRITRMTR